MTQSNENAPRADAGSETRHGLRRPDGLVANTFCLFAAALAAAAIAGAVLHYQFPLFSLPVMTGPPGDQGVAARQEMERAAIKNAGGVFALAGATIAVLLAFSEGITRRSVLYVTTGIVSGVVFGGGLGIAGGFAALWLSRQPMEGLANLLSSWPGLIDMATTILVQAAGWTVTGLGIGLGTALPAWRWRAIAKGMAGGMLGALLAAIVYTPIVGIFFPQFQTDMLLPPESANRFGWLLTSAGLIGLLIGGLGRKDSTRP
jgi:hypothetical protein